jgi:transcriptional regulator with XRE-family HTH domain
MGKSEMSAWLTPKINRNAMKQADASRRLGVSQSMISRWVKGEAVPSPANCTRLAHLFGEPESVVMALAGYATRGEQARPERSIGDLAEELAARVRALERQRPEIVPHYGSAAASPRHGIDADSRELGRRFDLDIDGDCLMPDVRPGATVRFDRHRTAVVGSIVAAIVNGEWHVKRVIERNGLWTLADNHDQVIAPVEDVEILGVMDKRYRVDED